MDKDKEIFEKVYEEPEAVWTKAEPPPELVELVEGGQIKPSKAVDIGCGEGFYSIYLASKGFDVLGIDISEKAIEYAKKNAKEQGVVAHFMPLDLYDLDQLAEKFDFVLEWAIMHHIMPPQRQKYVEGLTNLLNDKGKYLSVCFNEKSPMFKKSGEKFRTSPPGANVPAGTKLYFSSLDELKSLFESHFKIIEAKLIEVPGKGWTHIENYFFMEK